MMRGTRTSLSATLSVALLAALALPAAAAAQEEVANPTDPWVHEATGTPFPARIDEFQRRQVFEYSEDGRDAGANYFLQRGDDWVNVSLYVYPTIAGVDCKGIYEDAKANVAAYTGAQLLSEELDPPPAGRGDPVAFHARYRVPAGSMRADLPETRSDVYLYCPAGNEWLVKYRATWTAGTDFAEDVEQLLHAVEWPDSLGG